MNIEKFLLFKRVLLCGFIIIMIKYTVKKDKVYKYYFVFQVLLLNEYAKLFFHTLLNQNFINFLLYFLVKGT